MSRRIPSDTVGDESFAVPIHPVASARDDEIERIYLAYYRDVYRYVLAFTGTAEDAEEITADTFERALRMWKKPPDQPLPWLLLTARRKATDRWRRARRWARVGLTLRSGQRSGADEGRTEFWLWFAAVSRLLTDRQREVLVLRYQRDLTDADVSRIMGISESGVRSLAARALEVLRANPEVL